MPLGMMSKVGQGLDGGGNRQKEGAVLRVNRDFVA